MEIAMPVLLRHPALVPALFSRALEPEPQPPRGAMRRRLAGFARLSPATAWATVVLVEVPLVKAGLVLLGLASHA